MKTKNSDVYLKLLDEYFSGNGIPWGEYNLQRKDIMDMIAFYSKVLNHESFVNVVQYLVSDLLYIE